MRRVMLAGPAGMVLAWLGGAHPLAALLGLLLFVPSVFRRGSRGLRIVLAVAAPMLAFAFAAVEGIWDLRILLLLPAAALAWTPLFVELGGRPPVQVWTLPAVLALSAAVLAGPWGVPLVLSDIAPRAQVLVLAVMALLVHSARRI